MLSIGFSQKYYTLWDVTSTDNYTQIGDKNRLTSTTTHYLYIQNLSFDENKAKEKFVKMMGEKAPEVDTELYGRNRSWNAITSHDVYEDNELILGRYRGITINEIEDSKYLLWYYENSLLSSEDIRKSIIRETLLRRGYRSSPFDKECIVELEEFKRLKKELKKKKFIESLKKGYFLEDKEKVDLELKVLNNYSFNGTYGMCYIYTFYDSEKRIFKYMGSKEFGFTEGDNIKIKATIKHSKWNDNGVDVKETKLLRIKEI